MKIKNWSQFQHFKDRRPPWIKLYRDILDDIEWHELDAKSAKVLVMLWLIASENDGNLPDTKRLAFRLRMSESDTQASISKLSHWLEHSDISMISSGYQNDAPETEGETEKDEEKETDVGADAPRQNRVLTPPCPIEEIVSLYNEKLPMLPRVTVVNDSRKRAISARWREVVTTDKLDREKGLEFFNWYFDMVGQSKFLTGRAKNWKADIDFLFNPSKFPRIIEGVYHKDQS
jgi:hypothetical protein